MSTELPTYRPEKNEILDDNARKFIVETITPEFLETNNASAYTMTTDWLETGEDNEKKLAYKKFDTGDTQILLIEKTTKDGDRTSEKQKITEEEYTQLLESSLLRLAKRRYEFTYTQNGTSFSVKYDEFAESDLCILEVDATSEEKRNSFRPGDFPVELKEVTGDIHYYGYRVARML